MKKVSFDNTQVAYAYKSTAELKKALLLFRSIRVPLLSRLGSRALLFVDKYKIPARGIFIHSLFHQFCGGETLDEAYQTAEHLMEYRVDAILDFGVEAQESEGSFGRVLDQFLRTIEYASQKDYIPFISLKVTGLARFGLLEKISIGDSLTLDEEKEWQRAHERLEKIAQKAVEGRVKILIDAEESWIQQAVDDIATELMQNHNTEEVFIYNTYQMYRHDRLAYLKNDIKCAEYNGYRIGAKIVRGAYMEKERKRAAEMNYPSPIHHDKASTDRDYNRAVLVCAKNSDRVNLFVGTHNEYSCKKAMEFIDTFGLKPESVYFSQLYGMCDFVSFNMANAGYTVLKYLPYGPKDEVIPYLLRRAQENSSVEGQSSREVELLKKEIKRRKTK